MMLPEQYEEGRGPYSEIANLRAEIDRLRDECRERARNEYTLRAVLAEVLRLHDHAGLTDAEKLAVIAHEVHKVSEGVSPVAQR